MQCSEIKPEWHVWETIRPSWAPSWPICKLSVLKNFYKVRCGKMWITTWNSVSFHVEDTETPWQGAAEGSCRSILPYGVNGSDSDHDQKARQSLKLLLCCESPVSGYVGRLTFVGTVFDTGSLAAPVAKTGHQLSGQTFIRIFSAGVKWLQGLFLQNHSFA